MQANIADGMMKCIPVQIILSLYANVTQLLCSFDIDSCCFAYSPKDQKVWTTKRGLRSLEFGANLADSAHDSLSYTRRLEKYQMRGVKIAIPGFYEGCGIVLTNEFWG